MGYVKKYVPAESDILLKEAEQLSGLKKYLLDFSWIPEKQAIEVHLFEEYLVYAQMLGIARKVANQFKKLYPEIIEQSSYNTFDKIEFIDDCASYGINVAYNAQLRQKLEKYSSSSDSYSSGGDGYSSGGGGNGSFGGGRRRRRFPLK